MAPFSNNNITKKTLQGQEYSDPLTQFLKFYKHTGLVDADLCRHDMGDSRIFSAKSTQWRYFTLEVPGSMAEYECAIRPAMLTDENKREMTVDTEKQIAI